MGYSGEVIAVFNPVIWVAWWYACMSDSSSECTATGNQPAAQQCSGEPHYSILFFSIYICTDWCLNTTHTHDLATLVVLQIYYTRNTSTTTTVCVSVHADSYTDIKYLKSLQRPPAGQPFTNWGLCSLLYYYCCSSVPISSSQSDCSILEDLYSEVDKGKCRKRTEALRRRLRLCLKCVHLPLPTRQPISCLGRPFGLSNLERGTLAEGE